MVAKRAYGLYTSGWFFMTLLLLSLCFGEGAKAESTLERKLRSDEELSLAEIERMLKEVKVNGEIQQATLEVLAKAIADVVGDLAVLKAEKESSAFKVDFGPLEDSYSCFARCFEFLARGLGKIGRDLMSQLLSAWANSDILLKTFMSVCVLHTAASIQSAALHSLVGIRKGWEALSFAGGTIAGLAAWKKKIPVKDSIEAYKQLASVTRYSGESRVEFVEKLVNKWKSMTPRLTDSRFLEILRQHLPREFLNTIYELDLGSVDAETVLKKWNSYVKIHNLRDAGGQTSSSTEPIHKARALQAPGQGDRRERGSPRRSGRCYRCNGAHEARECSWPRDVVCNFCKKAGHVKAACQKLRGRVQAIENPLYDQDSASFDGASIVEDPCIGDSILQQTRLHGEGDQSLPSVNSVTAAVYSTMPSNRAFAELYVQKLGKTRCLLDTGAAVSVISARLIRERGIQGVDLTKKTTLRGFNKTLQSTEGVILLGIKHGNNKCRVPFHVVNEEIETIVGFNALKKLRTIWDIGADTVTMGGAPLTLSSSNSEGQ